MKRFYNSKSLRERVMMAVFAFICAAWWSLELVGRTRAQQQAWHSAGEDAKVQQMWLSQGARVGDRTADVAKQFDPAKTMNATQAYAEINRLAQGLPLEIGTQRTDRTDRFALHSLQVTIRRADMASLVKFYTALGTRAPYLGIDQCMISADRTAPGMVTASFRIYSVERATP